MSGAVTGMPKTFLQLEGLLVFVAAAAAYGRSGTDWWLFAALLLAPDLFMAGYLIGPKLGSAFYNIGHWYGLPFACFAWGVFGQTPIVLAVGLIWAAHIGADRALGFGLKYPDGFGASHLGPIDKARRATQNRC